MDNNQLPKFEITNGKRPERSDNIQRFVKRGEVGRTARTERIQVMVTPELKGELLAIVFQRNTARGNVHPMFTIQDAIQESIDFWKAAMERSPSSPQAEPKKS